MPRSKSGLRRPIINITNIAAAIEDIERGMTIETAAKKHTIAKTTLWRHYKKHQLSGKSTYVYETSLNNKQVFTDEEEIFLSEYIKNLANLKYALNKNDVMKFAYLIAHKNNKKMPLSWHEKESAGKEWLLGFLKRHPNMPLGKTDDTIMLPSADTTIGNAEDTTMIIKVPSPSISMEKCALNMFPNLNESLSLYLFSQIYNLMKITNTITDNFIEK